jgi:oligopeptide/dipeptide ABC transporter ATP-binding protein
MAPILEVSDLKTHIQLSRSVVQAVDGVSFSLEAGETLGLVGESGCGKSMTGLSLMGLLPSGGWILEDSSIRLDGRELVGLKQTELRKLRGNEIAMVFQDPLTSLDPTKTVGYQVAEPVRLHRGASKQEALDRAVEVLTLVGLPRPKERLDDFPHQLSGGLRQRVMIAMALANEPKVLIADEPTTALDVTIQAQILSLLADLKDRLNMAMILITHDMGVVAGHADRINVMYAGKIVETADTDQLFATMRHPYTQGLLASIPRLAQDNTQRLYSIPGIPPDLAHPPSGCRYAARCAYATDQCREQEPELLSGALGNKFACWHPVEGPVDLTVDTVAHERSAAASTTGALLQVADLVKEFPVRSGLGFTRRGLSVKAVSGVSLELGPGQTFGLVGESGCGKTTLGRMIVGLDDPDRGRVTLSGLGISELRGRQLRTHRRDLQMMFQDPYGALDPRMRVGSILTEPLKVQGIGTHRERTDRASELLAEVGLPRNALERFPHEFSGGQRQRLGLARALILNPKIIVADEPVSALDVSIRAQVLNLMKRLQASHDLSYVVISHDLAVVKYLADRIGVMYLGKMVEVGSGREIYERPAHPYTAGLLEAIPVPEPAAEREKRGGGIKGELPSPLDPPSGCRFRTRCPFAQEVCSMEEPLLRRFGEDHVAACHFPLQTPVGDAVQDSVAA